MPSTRRSLLTHAALAATACATAYSLPRRAHAQERSDEELLQQLDADLHRHASFGEKFSGGPGDHATADWVANRLSASGYDVEVSQFDAPYFVENRSELTIGDETFDVVAQAPVFVTQRGGVNARLALVEEEVGDVADCIAVIVAPFDRHAALFTTRGIGQTVDAAARAGAAAIVVVTTGPSEEAVALNAPEDGPFVPVPTSILAPRLAGPVVDAARAGTAATLHLTGEATQRPSRNVVATFERGPRWIAISTPRSGWYTSVAERGTGTAVFLELADWTVKRFPEHSLFLMNTGAHEYFFAGSHRVLHLAPPPERTDVWAHIGATLAAKDAVQRDGEWQLLDTADPERWTMATDAARDIVAESFAGLSGLEEPRVIRPQAGELSTFTDMGFSRAFACIGLHRWFHTRQDLIDCVDARLLLPVLKAHQRTIERLVETA